MKRPIVFVMLAGMGAMLAALVVFSAIRKRESEVQRALAHTVEVVVAAKEIPLGEKLEPADVKLAHWSRDSVPEGAFTDPQAVAGSFARGQFVINEPVVASKLYIGEKVSGVMPLLIPPGMRAMSVPVDEVADVAGFVEPHTRVDILVAVSGTAPGEASFSRIVLQNIEVLAVAQEIEHVKDEPHVVKVVTLLVTPVEAEKLTLASREGMLRLAMRNYNDAKIVSTKGIALTDLLHEGGAVAATLPVMQIQPALGPRSAHGLTPLRVEVMRDGKSSEAISFVRSGLGAHSLTQVHHEDAATSQPPLPAAPEPPTGSESPVSSAKAAVSASFAATPESGLSTIGTEPDGGGRAATNTNPAAPLRPGDPGYVPEPKTYEVR
jgi:pilus assembly protein CpaB